MISIFRGWSWGVNSLKPLKELPDTEQALSKYQLLLLITHYCQPGHPYVD